MKFSDLQKYTYRILIIIIEIFALVTASIHVTRTVPPNVQSIIQHANISKVRSALNESRRIMNGEESRNTRPYMVYLKLPSNDPKYKNYRRWLCGGVIVHEEYILTSAACIEDAQHFYIVSGTYRHNEEDDRHNNNCIKNGAKKAVWKCIPRNYVFDGHENDNLRWMNNDIAIVKVEDEFDFNRRVRGCDFVPKPICYNNQSSSYEKPGNTAIIAGWGSTEKYYDEKYVECKDIMYSDEYEKRHRRVLSDNELVLHSAYHNETRRRDSQLATGGFCENDHGGPLIYGEGSSAIVIGIISACLVKERTNKCYGPFLYTSVYKNRVLINCAIYKDYTGDCTKIFRSGDTHREEEITWANHPDGPAKNEVTQIRRREEVMKQKELNNTKALPTDKVIKHGGVILRTFADHAKMRMESLNGTA